MAELPVTNADFARAVCWIAKAAASWAGDALCPPNDANAPMPQEALDRFRVDILHRLDLATGYPIGGGHQDWVPLAKALFEIERDSTIKDQAWFDFQGKAQRLIALMQNQK